MEGRFQRGVNETFVNRVWLWPREARSPAEKRLMIFEMIMGDADCVSVENHEK
jgi:hypothetical protein